MREFIQLHLLVSYPPSNLNRDDLGRPKTAVMGGKERLRVSSQSLKRAWRQSDVFKESLSGYIGVRTRRMGSNIEEALASGSSLKSVLDGNPDGTHSQIPEKKAKEAAIAIASKFGKCDKDSPVHKQMVHFSQEEIEAIDSLLAKIAESGNAPDDSDLDLLRKSHKTVDIGMFGRMLADAPVYNCDAAVQVSHAITVHDVIVEDDDFTAVDDLNTGADTGSGHIGESEFAAGLFYTYVCINRDLLVENLSGDEELANKAIKALVEASAKVSPGGKQNSFASRAYASYILAEKGTQQPRSLAVSFLKPVRDVDMLGGSVRELEAVRGNMEKVYGKCTDDFISMNVQDGTGSLDEILAFVSR